MYVSTSKHTKNGKTYTTHMLRHSYRQNGKVKHKNIGCLNLCSSEELEAIKLALKHKKDILNWSKPEGIKIKQGKSFGSVWAAYTISRLLKIDKALGEDEAGKIGLLQVLARVIGQGSKLCSVRMQDFYALGEVIGLKEKINEDKLYRNLDWLSNNQKEIEKRLWKYNINKAENHLFLYDVTSTYLEGIGNEYGAYGYNRDGKKGKKQIVVGLLTDQHGTAVKVSIFEGNTNDTKTFGEQVKASTEDFGVKKIVFVGDRGMIKSPQIRDLPDGCTYITAISKKEIETLITSQTIQLNLFDSALHEVTEQESGIRYILRFNPIRRDEIRSNRGSKIRKILKLVEEKKERLQSSKRTSIDSAHKLIAAKIKQYKLEALIELKEVSIKRTIEIKLRRDNLKKVKELDGCYVIKSNVSVEMSRDAIHDRYKDLKLVEDGFRTMKQSHLELRPVHVRKKARTEAHVFIVMLAYMIVRKMRQLLAGNGKEILTKEVLRSLDLICLQELCDTGLDKKNQKDIYKLPDPSDLNKSYLERLNIKLPEAFINCMSVATKNLAATT